MKNILIFLFLVITTIVFAQKGDNIVSPVLKIKKAKVIAKDANLKPVVKLEGTQKLVSNDKTEEKKYESKIFLLNSDKKGNGSLGSYYIKGDLPLPQNFTVKDVPNDGGGVIEITWKYHTNNNPELFEIFRKTSKETKFKKVKEFDTSSVNYLYVDKTNKEWETYQYQIQVNGKPFKINDNIALVEFKLNDRKEMSVGWNCPSNKLPKEFTITRRTVEKGKILTDYKKIKILKSEKNVSYLFRDSSLNNDLTYNYKIRVKKDGLYAETSSKDMKPETALFDMNKLVMLLAGIFLVLAIVFFIRMARSGKELYIRRIAGLDAVDDAVGRATEMGREIMFVPGITDIDDPQTIAGLTILGRVAKLTAQYKTPLSVPVSKSMVMITGREIVKESYLSAGRPENFQDGMIYYLTDDQFGFAAGVDGIMVREKPATIFLQGAFYAESLILAETGHHIGAIQISGTAAPSQLPFFITACDYTLMGEELYAASAYLSREPQLLGSLRGQDAGKAVILLAIIAGIILETASFVFDMPNLSIKEYFKLK